MDSKIESIKYYQVHKNITITVTVQREDLTRDQIYIFRSKTEQNRDT